MDPTQLLRTKTFIARKSVAKAYGQIIKTHWSLEEAVHFVEVAVKRDVDDGNSGKMMKNGGMLSTLFVALTENQQAANIKKLPWMRGEIDNASTAIFLYCMKNDDVTTLKTLYGWVSDFAMVSPKTEEDGVCDIALERGATKCHVWLAKRRSPTNATPRARPIPKKKNLLILFKQAILRVIAKHRAARALVDKEAAHFAALTLANREEAAKRAAIREAAKLAKEKKEAPVARLARLPPFPTVVAPPAPPTPRRVAEKAASQSMACTFASKKAEERLRLSEDAEKKKNMRRIAREIGGS